MSAQQDIENGEQSRATLKNTKVDDYNGIFSSGSSFFKSKQFIAAAVIIGLLTGAVATGVALGVNASSKSSSDDDSDDENPDDGDPEKVECTPSSGFYLIGDIPSDCNIVKGDVQLGSDNGGSERGVAVEIIEGKVTVHSPLTTIDEKDLPNVKQIGSLDFNGAGSLEEVNAFKKLDRINGDLRVRDCGALTSFELAGPGLSFAPGAPEPTTLRVFGDFRFENLAELQTLKIDSFHNLDGGELRMESLPKLESIAFTFLASDDFDITLKQMDEVTSVAISILTSTASLRLEDMAKLTSINFGALETVTGNVILKNLDQFNDLEDGFKKLETVGGIEIVDNDLLEEIPASAFPELTTVDGGTVTIKNNHGGLTSVEGFTSLANASVNCDISFADPSFCA